MKGYDKYRVSQMAKKSRDYPTRDRKCHKCKQVLHLSLGKRKLRDSTRIICASHGICTKF